MPKIATRKQTIHTGLMRANATVLANSFNEESLTMDVEFASEYPVLRYSWEKDEYYLEVLEISNRAVDFQRIAAGASVLKDHRGYTVDAVVGVTLKGWVEGKKTVATIQFADTDDLADFRKKVQKGIIRNISVGYEIEKYVRSVVDKNSYPIWTATRWTPHEISFVAIPADPTVGARSKARAKKEAIEIRDSNNLHLTTITDMAIKRKVKAPVKTKTKVRAEEDELEDDNITDPEDDEDEDDEDQDVDDDNDADDDDEEEAPVRKKTAVKRPVKRSVNTTLTDTERAQIRLDERIRQSEIRKIGERMGLSAEFITKHADSSTSVNKFRKLALDEWENADPAKPIRNKNKVGVISKDEKDKLRTVRGTALAVRTGHLQLEDIEDKELRNAAHAFQMHDLMSVARMCVEETGERTTYMSKREIAQRAISPQSTSEFPALLGALTNTLLLPKYIEDEYVWNQFSSVGTLSDFKEYSTMRSWGLENLKRVGETEEYKQIPLVDAKGESVRLFKHGGIVSLSWEAIVNDDLGAFNEIIADLGISSARTLEDAVFDMFLTNAIRGPKMRDTLPTYDAGHDNIIAAAAWTHANIDAIRQKMLGTKDDAGRYTGFNPSILLVNTIDESIAKSYNTSTVNLDVTNKSSGITNPTANIFKKIVSSPRVTPGYRYVFADPRVAPVVRVSYLDGERTPVIERHEEFRQDAINFKVRFVFGTNIISYRGTAMQPAV